MRESPREEKREREGGKTWKERVREDGSAGGIVPAGALYREEITFPRGDAQPAETGS